MKVLVVGAGGQGAPCASILSRDPDVSEIVLADINEGLLEKVSEKIGSDKISTTRVDAGSLRNLMEAAKGVDVIINLTHLRFNAKIMEAALKSGAHYIDTAFDEPIWNQILEDKPLEFDKEFKEAGLTAIIGCGEYPGTISVLARHACDNFDSVDAIRIRLGGRPKKKNERAIETWEPTWSPTIALDDYADEVTVFMDGKFNIFPPFSGMEEYEFPDPVGPVLLSWHNHEEPMTLSRFIGKGVKNVDFKYPVNMAVGAMIKLGLASRDPIDVKGVKVAPRDVLLSLVRHPVNTFLTENEEAISSAPSSYRYCSVVEVEGMKDGDKMECKIILGGDIVSAEENLEMFRRLGTIKVGVAAPAIVGAKMIMEGYADRGVIAAECLDPTAFLKKMADIGVPIKFREIISRNTTIS